MLKRAVVAAAAVALLAACGGGGDDDDAEPTTTATAAPAPSDTTSAAADGAVATLQDVKSATIQILAEGSFRDPAEGTTGFAGSGSGFFIDPSGIAVTNNHVVTGAGSLKVRVGGSDEELPARVLGVSECNDLAVIEVTEGGPYPFLEWADGEPTPGNDVYAAGFPLGDPEFTVTRGVVSKAEADGDTTWASVRHVIEHDANIQPGNSGGPLVNADGKVVAVNYAGGDPGTGTSQFFAIARDLAEPLTTELQEGDAETIGVNGEAFVSEDGSLSGVWVSGVAAGSPASKAGVEPGDVITKLGGVTLDSGTMAEYCDVLRSAREGGATAIEVVRFDTEEVWAGELNGEPMVARFSFAQDLGDEVEDTAPDGNTESYDYEQVTDDTGAIVVEVPTAWAERSTSPQDLGLPSGPAPAIIASANLQGYNDTYTEPGMAMVLVPSSDVPDQATMLDNFAEGCDVQSREPYSDAVFSGTTQILLCEGATVVGIVASPTADPSRTVVINVQVASDADLAALDQILYTFNIA